MLPGMKALAVLLLVSAACGGDDVEFYPVNPGGGGPPGGVNRTDASVANGDSGVQISGRVCLINDARNPTSCSVTGAGGLTVTLGTRTATTMADGTFTISVMTGTSNVWRVSGTGIVSSATAVIGANVIPALSSQLYTNMLAANNVVPPAGSGTIIAKLTSGGGALTNATATTTPPPSGNVFYDADDAITWDQTATGAFGAVWVPGIAAGTATLTVTNASQGQSQLMNIPVFADTITFVFADVP